jgi:hypothetical protein
MEEVYKINPNIAWREIDGQILILDSQQNQMAHDLNEMGTFIFLSLSRGKRISEIRDILAAHYSTISKEDLKTDLEDFINKLSKLNLIQS